MRRTILASLLPALLLSAAPAVAQSRAAQARWDAAQARFDREAGIFARERDIYRRAGGRVDARFNDPRYGDPRYNDPRYNDPRYDDPRNSGAYGREDYDDRFATDYDASRYYRDGNYQERRLSAQDEVFRGSDGRYYCKRNDGTTGLIIGGAAGGILGNVIDGGRRRTGGTLIGGALGALLGRTVDQGAQNQDVRCR